MPARRPWPAHAGLACDADTPCAVQIERERDEWYNAIIAAAQTSKPMEAEAARLAEQVSSTTLALQEQIRALKEYISKQHQRDIEMDRRVQDLMRSCTFLSASVSRAYAPVRGAERKEQPARPAETVPKDVPEAPAQLQVAEEEFQLTPLPPLSSFRPPTTTTPAESRSQEPVVAERAPVPVIPMPLAQERAIPEPARDTKPAHVPVGDVKRAAAGRARPATTMGVGDGGALPPPKPAPVPLHMEPLRPVNKAAAPVEPPSPDPAPLIPASTAAAARPQVLVGEESAPATTAPMEPTIAMAVEPEPVTTPSGTVPALHAEAEVPLKPMETLSLNTELPVPPKPAMPVFDETAVLSEEASAPPVDPSPVVQPEHAVTELTTKSLPSASIAAPPADEQPPMVEARKPEGAKDFVSVPQVPTTESRTPADAAAVTPSQEQPQPPQQQPEKPRVPPKVQPPAPATRRSGAAGAPVGGPSVIALASQFAGSAAGVKVASRPPSKAVGVGQAEVPVPPVAGQHASAVPSTRQPSLVRTPAPSSRVSVASTASVTTTERRRISDERLPQAPPSTAPSRAPVSVAEPVAVPEKRRISDDLLSYVPTPLPSQKDAQEELPDDGGIPPPPPPPGSDAAMLYGMQPKAPVEPKIKLRPWHWEKLPVNVAAKSFWRDVKDEEYTFDQHSLELLFSIDEKADAPSGLREREIKSLLPLKRGQNIGIFLSQFKLTRDELNAKLSVLADEREGGLSLDQIANLKRCTPTAEEVELYEHYPGNKSEARARRSRAQRGVPGGP